jgi:hypothetical protein
MKNTPEVGVIPKLATDAHGATATKPTQLWLMES